MTTSNYGESQLKLYSLGIVVEDKKLNTDYIVVVPIETLSDLDGDLSKNKTLPKSKNNKVSRSNSVLAKWVQNGQTNRITSPNVYANETVRIFRFADNDEYFWDTYMHEPDIRRLEHVQYSYSNKKTPLEKYDDNSSYYSIWSTLKKFLHIHTSTNDGEASGYDFKVNTKTGIFTLEDTQNNQIIWNSTKKTLTIQNFNDFDIDINNNVTAKIGGNVNVNVNGSTTWTCPNNTINGNLNINGNLGVSGNSTCTGTISADTMNAPNGSVPGPKN